jgi:hypothetical protein
MKHKNIKKTQMKVHLENIVEIQFPAIQIMRHQDRELETKTRDIQQHMVHLIASSMTTTKRM